MEILLYILLGVYFGGNLAALFIICLFEKPKFTDSLIILFTGWLWGFYALFTKN